MASSCRLSNSRSPLVMKQRLITNFFSPGKSSLASISSRTSTLRPPSSNKWKLQEKKKPLLVTGHNVVVPAPESNKNKAYSAEVVGKRIRVYWTLDEAWYSGLVKSFDGRAGKHTMTYDNSKEEALELAMGRSSGWRPLRRRLRSNACSDVDAPMSVLGGQWGWA